MAISLACQEQRLTPAEALRAATIGGAAAPGLQHQAGSVAPGKRCDLLLLAASSPQALPHHCAVNPASGVIAAGKVVVRDRALVHAAPAAGPVRADGGLS
jgi:imidazolonepropionase